MGSTSGERDLVAGQQREAYIPQIGDIIRIPGSRIESPIGHEQALNRPALVVSANAFNKNKKLAWVCPITHTDRADSTQIPIRSGQIKTDGFILVDQLRTIDWIERKVTFVEKCPAEYLKEALLLIRRIAPLPPEWAPKSS